MTRTGLDASLLVPLQQKAIELLAGATRISLIHGSIFSGERLAHYEEAVRSILSGVTPAAAFSTWDASWKIVEGI